MKQMLLTTLLALGVSARAANLIPRPNTVSGADGAFTLTAGTVIIRPTIPLRPLAEYLAEFLPLETAGHAGRDGAVRLEADRTLPPEGYRLEIGEHGITVTGGGYSGVFNGIQTLLQLLPAEVYAKNIALPVDIGYATVEDAPQYAYRGMMLDVARTWMDAPRLKRYIDLLAYHKINKLHLHLSDDEAWRIEIKSHPELASVGGFRGGGSPVAAVYGKWQEKYGGYYTQECMRSIIRYAAARNIEIIPEIDLPGHSRTMAQLHPEILCRYPYDASASMGYDCRSAWCAAREENYSLLEDILDEICSLFPSHYIHIGGDEVDMSQWERCPDCRELMRRRNMAGCHELEDYFMSRLDSILAARGKSAAVWNEASRTGNLPRTARVHGWESVEACRRAAAAGYATVIMPGQYFYFDMRQSPREDGHLWAAIFDAGKTYGFDLAKEGFTARETENVIGFEGSFFSEAYLSHDPESTDYPDYMLFPRVCALAELCWSRSRGEWPRFYERLTAGHYDRLSAMGVAFRLFPPKIEYAGGEFSAATDDGSEVYYRREGETAEHLLQGGLRTDEPQLYTFRSRRGTGRSPEVADESHYRAITPAVELTSSMPESAKAPFSRIERYGGQAWTRRAGRDGDWLLFSFERPFTCRRLRVKTGSSHLPKNIFDSGYVEISEDGEHFMRIAELDGGAASIAPKCKVKALRVVCTTTGNGCRTVAVQPLEIRR